VHSEHTIGNISLFECFIVSILSIYELFDTDKIVNLKHIQSLYYSDLHFIVYLFIVSSLVLGFSVSVKALRSALPYIKAA
jgi:hypothetical protein